MPLLLVSFLAALQQNQKLGKKAFKKIELLCLNM